MVEEIGEMESESDGRKFSGEADILEKNLDQPPFGLTTTWEWMKSMGWRYHNCKKRLFSWA